jgi:hypothetical protein
VAASAQTCLGSGGDCVVGVGADPTVVSILNDGRPADSGRPDPIVLAECLKYPCDCHYVPNEALENQFIQFCQLLGTDPRDVTDVSEGEKFNIFSIYVRHRLMLQLGRCAPEMRNYASVKSLILCHRVEGVSKLRIDYKST